jgi:hypothetical protein
MTSILLASGSSAAESSRGVALYLYPLIARQAALRFQFFLSFISLIERQKQQTLSKWIAPNVFWVPLAAKEEVTMKPSTACIKCSLVTIVACQLSAIALAQAIPAGTILPARLQTSISSAKSHPGQRVTASLMQDVPLAGGTKLRRGTRISGTVLSVSSASGGNAAIAVKFDQIRHRQLTLPVSLSVRAIAGSSEVIDAGVPTSGPDRGTPENAYTTIQIGGADVVYRGGGPVMSDSEVVGEPVPYGVLVQVAENKERGCRGQVGEAAARQALWLFGSNACGVYGIQNLVIAQSGRGIDHSQSGVIVLTTDKAGKPVRVAVGSGLLFRVLTDVAPQPTKKTM